MEGWSRTVSDTLCVFLTINSLHSLVVDKSPTTHNSKRPTDQSTDEPAAEWEQLNKEYGIKTLRW